MLVTADILYPCQWLLKWAWPLGKKRKKSVTNEGEVHDTTVYLQQRRVKRETPKPGTERGRLTLPLSEVLLFTLMPAR